MQDEIFKIVQLPPQAGLVRIHPTVAKSIYDALVTEQQVGRRAAHLRQCFETILHCSERGAELGGAIFKVMGKSRIRRVIGEETVRATIKAIWNVLERQESPSINISLIRPLIDVATKVGLNLAPLKINNRLQQWMVQYEMTARGWGLLWQIGKRGRIFHFDYFRKDVFREYMDKAPPCSTLCPTAEADAVVGGDRMEQAALLSLVTSSVAITIFKKTIFETSVYSFLDEEQANSYPKSEVATGGMDR